MGSWSVHCCISKIAITASQECCVLPIRKTEYRGWVPATLPVFGKYDDYGRLKEIIENANTKLIEERFGVSIDEFCDLLTDLYDDHTQIIEKMGIKYDEMKDWSFMWIDKQVFDLMSKPYSDLGHFEFGDPAILSLFGFKQIDETTPDTMWQAQRFNQVWEKDSVKVYSDGRWAHAANNFLIYCISGKYGGLDNFISIPEELQYLKTKTQICLWSIMDEYWQTSNLLIAFDDRNYTEKLEWVRFSKRECQPGYIYDDLMKRYIESSERAKLEHVHRLYFEDINTFGEDIVNLIRMRNNMHAASTTWSPYVIHLTPQCGERKWHDILLKGFVEINNSYINNYNGDDDDE